MEPGISVLSSTSIAVAVVPIGHVPAAVMRGYWELISSHTTMELLGVKSFYSHSHKSPFAFQPWRTGAMRFRYLLSPSGASSPWVDFQAHRKILGVVGVCHLPSATDLSTAYSDFLAAATAFPDALALRCFAFDPLEGQVAGDQSELQHLITFPPGDRAHLEFHLDMMMLDFAAALLMGLEQWVLNADPSTICLTTPLDGAEEEEERLLDSLRNRAERKGEDAKRRRLGRLQKAIGDYCLLAGSPRDANDKYLASAELSRQSSDTVWLAGAIEGSVATTVLAARGGPGAGGGSREAGGGDDAATLALAEDVRSRYGQLPALYKRRGVPALAIESQLKLARFLLSEAGGTAAARAAHKSEAVALVASALEAGAALSAPDDRLVLWAEAGGLYSLAGLPRKRAFLLWQAARLCSQLGRPPAQTFRVLLEALPPPAPTPSSRGPPGAPRATGVGVGGSGGVVVWDGLERGVMMDLLSLAARAGDAAGAWGAAAHLLRAHHGSLPADAQARVLGVAAAAAARLPRGALVPAPLLPVARPGGAAPPAPGRAPVRLGGGGSSGPFIFSSLRGRANGAAGGKQPPARATWVAGEPAEFTVLLDNPLAVSVDVDHVHVAVEGGDVEPGGAATAVTVPAGARGHPVVLRVVPRGPAGPASVVGAVVGCLGVAWREAWLGGAATGVDVVAPLPLAVARVPGFGRGPAAGPAPGAGATSEPASAAAANGGGAGGGGAAAAAAAAAASVPLLAGQVQDLVVELTNAGAIPIGSAKGSVTCVPSWPGSIQLDPAALEAATPLAPGATARLPLRVVAAHQPGRHAATVVLTVAPPGEGEWGRRATVALELVVEGGLAVDGAELLRGAAAAAVVGGEGRDVGGGGHLAVSVRNPTGRAFHIRPTLAGPPPPAPLRSVRVAAGCTSAVLVPAGPLLPAPAGGAGVDDGGAGGGAGGVDAFVEAALSRVGLEWVEEGSSRAGSLALSEASLRSGVTPHTLAPLLAPALSLSVRLGRRRGGGPGGTWAGDAGAGPLAVGDMVEVVGEVRNAGRDPRQLALTLGVRHGPGEREGALSSVVWAGSVARRDVECAPGGHVEVTGVAFFLHPGEFILEAWGVPGILAGGGPPEPGTCRVAVQV